MTDEPRENQERHCPKCDCVLEGFEKTSRYVICSGCGEMIELWQLTREQAAELRGQR